MLLGQGSSSDWTVRHLFTTDLDWLCHNARWRLQPSLAVLPTVRRSRTYHATRSKSWRTGYMGLRPPPKSVHAVASVGIRSGAAIRWRVRTRPTWAGRDVSAASAIIWSQLSRISGMICLWPALLRSNTRLIMLRAFIPGARRFEALWRSKDVDLRRHAWTESTVEVESVNYQQNTHVRAR